jgi:hypothetical protein
MDRRRQAEARRPKDRNEGAVAVEVPAGLPWFIWRVAIHERTKATLYEIQQQWSLADLVNAHMALDVVDELDARKHERMRNE